jgi:hypothetical protein
VKTPILDETLLALTHLICGEDDTSIDINDRPKAIQRWHATDAKTFDGFDMLDANGEDFAEDDPTTFVLLADDATDQPIWPLDICSASRATGEGWGENSWHFIRVKTLRPAEWRGRLRRFLPRMVDVSHRISEPNGRTFSARLPYSLVNGQAVRARTILNGMSIGLVDSVCVDPSWYGGEKAEPHEVNSATGLLRVSAGLALRRHYLWSVLLGEGDGPRARFVTDPAGVREVFRLRDIPPGRARRAALLHWVRNHWRRRRDVSANDMTWVREHLRGARTYSWNGLRCEIVPAPADEDRLKNQSTKGRVA